jgi:hypothetical protein
VEILEQPRKVQANHWRQRGEHIGGVFVVLERRQLIEH